MKKILAIILTVCLMLTVMPFGIFSLTASAETATSGKTGDCTWSLDGNVLTITGNGNMADYVSSSAPWGTSVKEVIIENGVTNIGDYAFYECTRLKNITISNSVTRIGKLTFWECESLTSITIPNTVSVIGHDAFYNCVNLSSVYITDIAAWCNIEFQSYKDLYNGTPLSYAENLYLNNELLTILEIPDGVTSIGNAAFKGYDTLTRVIIPNSVKLIGDYAFSSCDGLTSINIPDSVTQIGLSAFEYCSSLKNINIPDSVVDDKIVFRGCKSLETVNFGNGITNITSGTFDLCYNLKEVILGNGVTSIHEDAFSLRDTLERITITKNLRTLSTKTFLDCESLEEIIFIGTRKEWENMEYSEDLQFAEVKIICVCMGEHTYTDENDSSCNECDFIKFTLGDIDSVKGVTDADAEYLLMYTFFPEDYPVNQECDFNGDGKVNDADAEHLLMYTFFPEDYPLH